MNKIIHRQNGFTVLELIIATSVFSVMLLLTTTGMIQIGRVYYKGIITSKTQEATRAVSDEIVRTVQFGGTATLLHNPGFPGAVNINGLQTYAVCMNNVRYSYALDTRLASENTPRTARHVLWLDVIKDRTNCQPVDLTQEEPGINPPDGSVGAANTDLSPDARAQRRELLASNMRLSQFEVVGAADIVSVKIKVMYGEDDIIADPDSNPATPNSTCISTDKGGQFCAFSALDTFAKRRL